MEPKHIQNHNWEKKMELVHHLSQSWTSLLKSWKLTIFSIINDLLFFFLFSMISTKTVEALSTPLHQLYSMAGENISKLAKNLTNEEAASAILTNYSAFMNSFYSILKIAALFLMGSLALWLVFQFLSWYTAHLISAGKKTISALKESKPEIISFLSRFWTHSIAGMIVVVGILYASMRISVAFNVSRFDYNLQAGLSALVAIAMFSVLYTLYCGYASPMRDSKCASLQRAIQSARTMIPPFLITIALMYGTGFILSRLLATNLIIALLFGIIVAAPSFTFGRVLMILSAKKSHDIRVKTSPH